MLDLLGISDLLENAWHFRLTFNMSLLLLLLSFALCHSCYLCHSYLCYLCYLYCHSCYLCHSYLCYLCYLWCVAYLLQLCNFVFSQRFLATILVHFLCISYALFMHFLKIHVLCGKVHTFFSKIHVLLKRA